MTVRSWKEQRVAGGFVQVDETAPGVIVASWLADPGPEPFAPPRPVPGEVAAEGVDAALAWAVGEWDAMRLGEEAPEDPAPPHGDPIA